MVKNVNFKVGDKIVELERIFQIFKIEVAKKENGDKEKVIHYKTFFEEETPNPIICTLPLNNIEMTDIRKPVSKRHMNEVLKKLKNGRVRTKYDSIDQIKGLLRTNDLFDVVKAIQIMQKEKNDYPEKFNRNKKRLVETAVKMLAQEYALINRVKLENAQEKIQGLI